MKTLSSILKTALLLAIVGCSESAFVESGEKSSDSATQTETSVETETTPLDSDTENGSDSGTTPEKIDCSIAHAEALVFVPSTAFCGYQSYARDSYIAIDTDGEQPFEIQNDFNSMTANCERTGCVFTCNPLDVIWLDIDGDDPETGESKGANVEYAVELSGEIIGSQLLTVTAEVIVTCGGQLCGESDCREDISDMVTWE